MSDPVPGAVDLPEPPGSPASAEPDVSPVSAEPDAPPVSAEPDVPPAEGPVPGSPDLKLALVVAVTVDLPTQHPTVVLREIESPRRQLSFSVGLAEGTMLSHAVRRIPTPRPLPLELLSSVIQGFDIDVVAVRLVGRLGAVYFAELDLRGKDGRAVFSCRPSDALVVALLQPVPAPILIDRRLIEQAGDVTPPGPPG